MNKIIIPPLRPDSKGRITLGKLAEGISSYRAEVDEHGKITLEPFKEIPAREHWLFSNPEALASVRLGLQQSARGEVHSRGSFAKYLDDDAD